MKRYPKEVIIKDYLSRPARPEPPSEPHQFYAPMKTKLKPLIPPDRKRCQAERRPSYSFMTFGGQIPPPLERCKAKPSFIVKESKPGVDGRRGRMSMCKSCYAVFIDQFGRDASTYTKIK